MQILEQPSDGVVAHLVALLREGLGEMPGALLVHSRGDCGSPRVDASNKACKALRRPGALLRHSSPPPAHLTEPLPLGIRVRCGI